MGATSPDLTLGSMRITPLELSDVPAVGALTSMVNAAGAVDTSFDPPLTTSQVHGALAYGHDLEPPTSFVGHVEGRARAARPLVFGALSVFEWDNPQLAWLELVVDPDQRNRGFGSAMLAHLEKAATDRGRTLLGTDAWEGTDGMAFAERHAFSARSRAVKRRQHRLDLPEPEVQVMHREAGEYAADYELLRLAGPVPEELVEPLVRVAASINDAPVDDLELEDDHFEPARVRDYEAAARLRDRTLYRVLARHGASGELAGHTTLQVEREVPSQAYQHDTAVAPGHRGHRLGLLLKADMLLWLADVEPQVETIDTWNTETNDPMIRVNERLGYRWVARQWQYQK